MSDDVATNSKNSDDDLVKLEELLEEVSQESQEREEQRAETVVAGENQIKGTREVVASEQLVGQEETVISDQAARQEEVMVAAVNQAVRQTAGASETRETSDNEAMDSGEWADKDDLASENDLANESGPAGATSDVASSARSNATGAAGNHPAGGGRKEMSEGQPRREYNYQPEVVAEPENKDREKIQELETAIDSFVQKNNNLKDDQGGKVTIGSGQTPLSPTAYHKQPTIVLPITQEQEKEGVKKPPNFALRWLVTLSQKLMKIFQGRFRYKIAPPEVK
jgi:hypothetical protein